MSFSSLTASLIRQARSAYSGRLLYVAHNVDEAEAVPFWDRLDAIGGRLEIVSTPGSGTRVRVLIPSCQPATA